MEAGWSGAALAFKSPAQLIWIFNGHKVREIKSEMRWLLSATAAAHTGANGGEACEQRYNHLKQELQAVCNDAEKAELNAPPKSQTPRSQEEFEQMLKANGT